MAFSATADDKQSAYQQALENMQKNGDNNHSLFKIFQFDEKNNALNAKILQYNFPLFQNIAPQNQRLGKGRCAILYAIYLDYHLMYLSYTNVGESGQNKDLTNMLNGLRYSYAFLTSLSLCEKPLFFDDIDYLNYYLKDDTDLQYLNWLKIAAWRGQNDAQLVLAKFYSRSNDIDHQKQAYQYWLMLANAGNRDAIYQLGNIYENGSIVDRDLARAFYYYQKSAKLNNTEAIVKLGDFYAKGIVVEKDLKKAFDYHLEAANSFKAESQFYLFKAYWNGDGVEQDKKAAIKWFYEAGSMRHINSQCLLGEELFEGKIFKKDTKEAYILCYMAKLRSDKADKKINKMVERIAQTMSDSDIKTAQKQVHACLTGSVGSCPRHILPEDPIFGFSYAIETYEHRLRNYENQ